MRPEGEGRLPSERTHDQLWLAPTELQFGTIKPANLGFAMELLFT
jgi:hypothetical protein